MVSSKMSRSRFLGMNPAPMPWILCPPGAPPEITGLSLGSTATTCDGIHRIPVAGVGKAYQFLEPSHPKSEACCLLSITSHLAAPLFPSTVSRGHNSGLGAVTTLPLCTSLLLTT